MKWIALFIVSYLLVVFLIAWFFYAASPRRHKKDSAFSLLGAAYATRRVSNTRKPDMGGTFWVSRPSRASNTARLDS